MTNAEALLHRCKKGENSPHDLKKLQDLKKNKVLFQMYSEDLSGTMLELVLHVDKWLAGTIFSSANMRAFELRDGVFSLTDYAPHTGMSVKALAKLARDVGFEVVVDRKRLYDKDKYHTCLVRKESK